MGFQNKFSCPILQFSVSFFLISPCIFSKEQVKSISPKARKCSYLLRNTMKTDAMTARIKMTENDIVSLPETVFVNHVAASRSASLTISKFPEVGTGLVVTDEAFTR